ncbi:hypothetical protein T484DRAFT_1901912 [Baffinella frigidus]|nr:hypothetical protein T484DRAFT_1901912 [Cryptophyta sp. CCMP2293]
MRSLEQARANPLQVEFEESRRAIWLAPQNLAQQVQAQLGASAEADASRDANANSEPEPNLDADGNEVNLEDGILACTTSTWMATVRSGSSRANPRTDRHHRTIGHTWKTAGIRRMLTGTRFLALRTAARFRVTNRRTRDRTTQDCWTMTRT